VALALLVFAASALLTGCGGEPRRAPTRTDERSALITGRRAPGPRPPAAARLARRFAATYARDAYLRRPPDLPGENAAVRAAVSAAASRVPRARRRIRPRLLGLHLWRLPDGSIGAAARIGDGRFPSFSVGFTIGHRGGRPLIISISPPD
jgi:hypothetical protein